MENFEIASYLLGLISGAFISSLLILIIYLLFIKKDETSSEEYLTDILDKFTGDEGEYLLQILNKTKDQATLVENLEERFDAFSKGLSSIGGQGQLAEINLEKILKCRSQQTACTGFKPSNTRNTEKTRFSDTDAKEKNNRY